MASMHGKCAWQVCNGSLLCAAHNWADKPDRAGPVCQVAGSGKYPPGTQFTYDSDDYLQHLTQLIAVRVF